VPPDHYVVSVPYWRTDVAIADDVIEEVARIIGYDEFPTTQLRGEVPRWEPQPARDLRERVRDLLAAAGLQEVITYSMTDLATLQKVVPPEDLKISPPLRVANPMSREYEYARTTLRGSILQTIERNLRTSGAESLAFFEIAKTYQPREDDLPHEIETACAAFVGDKTGWWRDPAAGTLGFYEAKSHVDTLLAALHLRAEYSEAVEHAYLPGRTAAVMLDGQRVGIVGQVHPRVVAAFEIKQDVAMFELDLEALLPHVPETVHYQPVSPYPPVEEDLAVIVDEDVEAGSLVRLVDSSRLVRSVSVLSVYTGAPIAKGKKSIALRVIFQADDHTLNEKNPDEVANERRRIVERLKRELNADLRT
jgi:phenylalanyl-tRNA synthetase beta chain